MKVTKGLHLRLGRFHLTISASRVFVYLLVLLMVAFTALPLIYVISTAFKPLDELLRFPPIFFVRNPTLDNFRDLLFATSSSSVPFLRYVMNSVFVAAVTVFLTILVSSIGAYSLVKLDLPFKGLIFNVIVATLMFPTTLATIPNYMVINSLGLMNTYMSLIIPKVAGAFGFFFVKQFCDQLPDALLEAARLDGASEWTVFWHIAMGLSTPILSVIALGAFTGAYGNFMMAFLLCQKKSMWTMMVYLYQLQQRASQSVGFAALIIAAVPTLIVFIFCQNIIIKGIVVPTEK